MTDKKTKSAEEKKEEVKQEAPAVVDAKTPASSEKDSAKAISKKDKPVVKRRYQATAFGDSLRMSKKHGMYICSFIKGKSIDAAMADLQKVLIFKIAVPFKGEIPHRKGKIMSGRYPINASKEFIYLLKGLKGNAIVNGMDLEKTRITLATANWASRPARRGGKLAKRTHIFLKAVELPHEGAKK